jgi:hypothetical protein
MLSAKFGSIWPSCFRGVDYNMKKLTDRRQVMAISHLTLWVGSGELKKINIILISHIKKKVETCH